MGSSQEVFSRRTRRGRGYESPKLSARANKSRSSVGDSWLRPLRLMAALIFCLTTSTALVAQDNEKLRVLIETDIGGDADDQASLVRFLLYCNEWDVEGIVTDRDGLAFHKDNALDHKGFNVKDGHELAMKYLDAYDTVHENLQQHANDYPTAEQLRQLTVPGWEGTNAGVDRIIAAADHSDSRPIWYANWGSNSGSTSNLRRAFDRIKRQRSAEEYTAFVGKFRICTLDGPGPTRQGHDQHIALHIETGYPEYERRWYHRFRPLTQRAGGFDVDRDVIRNHGSLGALYTTPKEGDSWTFVHLIPTGLSDPTQPTWGNWAGRYGSRDGDPLNKTGPSGSQFYWANQRDTIDGTTNRDNTVSRWAEHLQNDFRARMDWCVAKKYQDANHPPDVHCQGDQSQNVLSMKAQTGDHLALSAEGSSDPDGDSLSYHWFVYPEAGTFGGDVVLENANSKAASITLPPNAGGKSVHVVLQVTDNGTPALTRYRRIVIQCDKASLPSKPDRTTPRIIFDTDMGSDCDDVGALALLHNFTDAGSAEILGCVYSSTKIPYGVGVIDAINTYYGRPDLPIGANRARIVGDPVDKMNAEQHAKQTSKYGHDLVSTEDAEEDVNMLRRLLASQHDGSVTYVTVGHTASLSGLLTSTADEHSPLTGRQLIAKKIRQWVALGALRANTGREGHYAQDWNFFRNGTANYTAHVIQQMPVRCVFINAGSDVLTGKSLASLPDDCVVRCTYESWLKKTVGKKLSDQRPSWDLAAVYYAVEGLGPFLYEEQPGRLEFDESKGAKWIRGQTDVKHIYVGQREGVNQTFSDYLNERLAQAPHN